jgi:hypothetical protein
MIEEFRLLACGHDSYDFHQDLQDNSARGCALITAFMCLKISNYAGSPHVTYMNKDSYWMAVIEELNKL